MISPRFTDTKEGQNIWFARIYHGYCNAVDVIYFFAHEWELVEQGDNS